MTWCFVLVWLSDTQLIVEKASNGDRDVVGHAITLFIGTAFLSCPVWIISRFACPLTHATSPTDFVGMFVRILIILMKNKGDKKSDRK
jgi:hypothetical protein